MDAIEQHEEAEMTALSEHLADILSEYPVKVGISALMIMLSGLIAYSPGDHRTRITDMVTKYLKSAADEPADFMVPVDPAKH